MKTKPPPPPRARAGTTRSGTGAARGGADPSAAPPPARPRKTPRSVWRARMLERQTAFPLPGMMDAAEPLMARLRREAGIALAPSSGAGGSPATAQAPRRPRAPADPKVPVCGDGPLIAWSLARSAAAPRPSRPSRPPGGYIQLGRHRDGEASPRLPAPRLPDIPRDYGGPDPTQPCTGCPKRARCKAPCDLLEVELPKAETENRREVRSSVLSEPGRQDGGQDEQFLTIPAEWADDAHNVHSREGTSGRWAAFVGAYGGERLRDFIDSPLVLTRIQRTVVEQLLVGRERTDIRFARETSRQSVHKVVHAAMAALHFAFVVESWRGLVERVGPGATDEALDDDDVVAYAAGHLARAAGAPLAPGAPVDLPRVRARMRVAAAHLVRTRGVPRVCGTTRAMRCAVTALVAALEDYYGR